MAALKPAYLIHGEDHGAVAERRANLKGLAEQQSGAAGVEILPADLATPEGVANALSAMTFAIGLRVIIVDGAERFKQAEVEKHLLGAMKQMPPETTVALFAREEGRAKAPAALHAAVKAAGGQIVAQETVKPWDLPKWVRAQARRLGLSLDVAAAKALVSQVGERQQRLLRELEKLALEAGVERDGQAPTLVRVEDIEARTAHSAQRKAFTLADALVAGDAASALSAYISLQAQGERITGLSYQIASRLREAVSVAERLKAGESPAEVRRGLRMPPKAAERFIADVQRSDIDRLKDAVCALADLELDLRGGSRATAFRRPDAALSEQTAAVRAMKRIAG